jgi:hypothetical protein
MTEVSRVIVFSSMQKALEAGFRWLDFNREYDLHVVELDVATPRGRVRALAFARPDRSDGKEPQPPSRGGDFRREERRSCT